MNEVRERSRQIAGTTAYRIVAIYGIATGTEMLRGIFIAFTLALMAVTSAEDVYREFLDLIGEQKLPRSGPRLVINNEDVA